MRLPGFQVRQVASAIFCGVLQAHGETLPARSGRSSGSRAGANASMAKAPASKEAMSMVAAAFVNVMALHDEAAASATPKGESSSAAPEVSTGDE